MAVALQGVERSSKYLPACLMVEQYHKQQKLTITTREALAAALGAGGGGGVATGYVVRLPAPRGGGGGY